MSEPQAGHNGQIRSITERINRLEDEKKTISDDIKDVYAEAKGNGLNPKALRVIVRKQRADAKKAAELQADVDAERETGLPLRIAFAGLWTAADRAGRFRWAPRQLKLDCLPYDECDFSRVLDALTTRGFIVRYATEGKEYGHIPSWDQHQVINNREKPSDLPAPNENNTLTREARVLDASATPLKQVQGEGKGKEGEGERDSEAKASGADAPPDPAIPEREYFLRGREVLGSKSGAMIANLLKAKGKNVALARAALEEASQKQSPMEFVAAICRGPPMSAKPLTEFQRKQQETNDVRAQLRNYANGGGGGGNPDRVLPDDPGQRSEDLRGRPRQAVLAIPGAPDRRSH
jgi:uncharacterized protein (UPF0335 family)